MLQHSRSAGSSPPLSRGVQRHPSRSTSHSRHGGPQAASFPHQSHTSSGSQCAQSQLTGWLLRRRQSLRHPGETPPRLQQHSTARQLAGLRHSSACKRARVPPAMARQQEAEAAAHRAPRPCPRSRSRPAHVANPQRQQRGRPTSRAAGSSGRARRRQPPLPPPSGHPRGQIQRGVPLPSPTVRRRSEAPRRWRMAARRQQHERQARAPARLQAALQARRPPGPAAEPWAALRPLQRRHPFSAGAQPPGSLSVALAPANGMVCGRGRSCGPRWPASRTGLHRFVAYLCSGNTVQFRCLRHVCPTVSVSHAVTACPLALLSAACFLGVDVGH